MILLVKPICPRANLLSQKKKYLVKLSFDAIIIREYQPLIYRI